MAKKKIPKKKDKTTEVFEIEDKGKTKVVKTESVTETPVTKPGQHKHQEKVLAWIFGSCVFILLLVAGLYFWSQHPTTYDYEGIEFVKIRQGDLTLYNTKVDFNYKGKVIPYNFYLRTNPNDLKKMDFDREDFKLMKFSVINFTDQFDCEGYQTIATANLKQIHEILGMKFLYDPTADCDNESRYTYYNLMKADKTEIEKIGENCYNIKIANCEILPATEKIMAEIFLANKKLQDE